MNLYKILFSHSAPKETKIGIKTYLLAENEDSVYDYIDKEYNYECWKDYEDDNELFDIYDGCYDLIGTETFREKIMRIRGDMNDEDYDYSDAYYGITLYGWELVKENIEFDLSNIIKLGVINETRRS